jgi:hypothetical protein
MENYAIFISFSVIPEVVEIYSDRYKQLCDQNKNYLVGSKEQCENVAKGVLEECV